MLVAEFGESGGCRGGANLGSGVEGGNAGDSVTNQGIGPRRTDTELPCYKGNKRRTRPFGSPTGLGPDGPWEIHMVTL